jgi:class 3 adenylate cyclase/DNA-binding winged helix-turn-helix (wHTH) protein/tetratricopeptide (TPR) repeat protein
MLYQFYDYVLHTERRELWRGEQCIAIEPKVFQVLLYLIENRDRVITKAELLDHCWPDTFVSESALTRCLTRLRKAVHGEFTPQSVIKTLPRQGYRFVAEVIVKPHDAHVMTAYPQQPADASPRAQSPSPSAPPLPLDSPDTSAPMRPDLEMAASPPLPSPVAERRQLTVMFCDVVESTALAGQLDPEDFRDVMLRYQTTCTAIIARYGGHIAQYLGDGLLVYFGYPQAHEDDAQRAGYTGLSLVDAMQRLNLQLEREYGVRLAVRIGMHTGLVVVGEMGGGAQHGPLASGVVPNLAAKIQSLASSNCVLMSASTKALAEGYFVWRPAGAHTLPGMSESVPIYQALQASGAQHRFDIAQPRGLTPLVGREHELGLLLERWGHVQEGDGQVVVLSGEAGIGKSRLVLAVKAHVADRAFSLECRCSPYHQYTAFHPLIDAFRRLLHRQGDQLVTSHQQQLEAFVAHYRFPPTESIQLLATLLDIALPDAPYPPLMLSPQQQRQKMLAMLVTFVVEQAKRQPVVLIVEDLHWVDPSTLELLDLLIDQGPMVPVLTVLTCRPGFQLPWGFRTHITPIALNRLSQTQVEAMVSGIAGGKSLPTEIMQQLVAKADGVPLFVEELTRMVIESAWLEEGVEGYVQRESLPSLAIPTTLQDSLMARLDRLEYGKVVAQLAATIGRQFTYDVLQAVAPWDATTLQAGLHQLVTSDLCYQRGIPPQSTYLFKHALIQEAAYQSLLKRTRQQYHQHIAQVLERQGAESGATQPELLAHHYTEANLPEQAVRHWHQAGHHALERWANQEAVAHFEHALAILQKLPEGRATTEQILDVRLALRSALQSLGKQDELLANLQEAERLAKALDDPQRLGQLYGYLTNYHSWCGNFERAVAAGQQSLTLGQAAGHADTQVTAKFGLGLAHCHLGNYTLAMTLCRALIDELVGDRLYAFTGMNVVQSSNVRGVLLCCLAEQGAFAEGSPYEEEMMRIAESAKHAGTLTRACLASGRFYLRQGEFDIALSRLERALEYCQVSNIMLWWPVVASHLGYALARTGHLDDGLRLLEQAISQAAAAQQMLFHTPAVVHMSEAYLLAGRIDEARVSATRALELARAHQERAHQAWAWWVQGEVAACAGPASCEQSVALYQQAFARAEELQMRPLQAHCHLGIGTVYSRTGDAAQARRALTTAHALYQAMDMTFWRRQAETALSHLAS